MAPSAGLLSGGKIQQGFRTQALFHRTETLGNQLEVARREGGTGRRQSYGQSDQQWIHGGIVARRPVLREKLERPVSNETSRTPYLCRDSIFACPAKPVSGKGR